MSSLGVERELELKLLQKEWVQHPIFHVHFETYRQVSNIRCTNSQNLSDSRPVLQLSLLNLLKPRVKSRMKM